MTTTDTTPASRKQRPDPATLPPLEITGSRRRILELLHRYRYLTPRLLALAYAGDNGQASSHVRHELAALWRHGLVERHYDSKRPRGQGSDQFIYTLALPGGRAVLDHDTYSRSRHQIFSRAQRAQGNYDHHLGLSELQLILELGADGWSVESFRADERTPQSRFTAHLPGGVQHTSQPDAWVTFALPSGQRPVYLFELERERKNNQRTARRLAAYAAYLTSPDAQRMLKRENATYAAAVFIAANESEVERHIEYAAAALKDWPRRERPQLFFWNKEDWYESQQMERREAVGTTSERTRQWTVNSLRSPRAILREQQLCDIHGKPRWLVPAAV